MRININYLCVFFLLFKFSFFFAQPRYLSVQKLSDLDFEIMFLGETKNITYDNPNAARFQINAKTNIIRLLYFSLSLPNYLINVDFPLDKIPIQFSVENSLYSYRGSNVNFNPYSHVLLRLRRGNNQINIFIGAFLRTFDTNYGGNYSGTIILNVEIDDFIEPPIIEPPYPPIE